MMKHNITGDYNKEERSF